MDEMLLRLKPYTMLPLERCQSIGRLAAYMLLPGALVQCGVFNGGSAAWLWKCAGANRHAWLFDSFQGLPEPTPKDGGHAHASWKRHYATSPQWNVGEVDKVAQAFGVVGANPALVHIVKGWFKDTLPQVDPGPIAILHIDADWYESVKQALSALYPKVVPGGLVILDDYGHWQGCRLAVDEYLAGKAIKLKQIDYTCHYFTKA